MEKLLENYNELKHIILCDKKLSIKKDFHLFVLMEEISKQITELMEKKSEEK